MSSIRLSVDFERTNLTRGQILSSQALPRRHATMDQGCLVPSVTHATVGSLLLSLVLGCSGNSGTGDGIGLGLGARAGDGGITTTAFSGGFPASGGLLVQGGVAAYNSSATSGVLTGGSAVASSSGGAGVVTQAAGTSAVTNGGNASSSGAISSGGSITGRAGATAGGTVSRGGTTTMGGAALGGGVAKGGTSTGSTSASASGTPNKGGTATGGATSKGGSSATGAGAISGSPVGSGGTTASPSDLWIAPDGSDSSSGNEAAPLATLTAAHAKVSAGQTIWIKPGTYRWSNTVKLTKNGTASSPIQVFAAAGARPVIDFSAQTCGDSSARGIQITGTYWHLKGFEIQKAGDNCIHIGGSHNTIEWVATHNCCDSGLQISADDAADATRGAYNTILNCDSYENYDVPTNGENADGFAPKLHIGPGNVFRGCRSWNNADDGFDLFASDDVVVIENCWAFLNGVLADGSGTSAGDGNGFKLGGAAASGDAYEGGAAHEVTNCFAFENTACGYTRNNNTSVPVLTACGGRADGKSEYCSLTNPSPVSFTMTGAQAKGLARNADGSLPAIH